MWLSLWYNNLEEKCRNDLLKPCHFAELHILRRECLYEDMLKIFSSEEAVTEYPFRVRFQGERGVDTGGLSREAFSTFWELAYNKHFDGSSSLVPVVSACLDSATLQVLGRILSFGYVACGFLPVRIAFPTLAAMLLHPLPDFPHDVLVEAFRDTLTPVDAATLKEALACREKDNFPPRLFNRLVNVFSSFECLEVPKPGNILKLCERSARYVCLTKPFAVLTEIGKGVPSQHHQFWKAKGVEGLKRLILALSVSPSKVLESIEEPLFVSPIEQRVFGYLTQYIGHMKVGEVQKFLRFCTGSSVCIVKRILITFNSSMGLSRCPIAHTCSCTLELPRTYSTFLEFSNEFNCVLQAEDSGWSIDAI